MFLKTFDQQKHEFMWSGTH